MVLVFHRLSEIQSPHSRFFTMDKIHPLVWQFLGVLTVMCVIAGAEWLKEKFKSLQDKIKQLLFEIEIIKKDAGLPLLLKNAPLQPSISYRIEAVISTSVGYDIYVEIEPLAPRKVISLTEEEIIFLGMHTLQSGDYFMLWFGDVKASAGGTSEGNRKIKIIPNPNMAKMLV